MDDFNLDDILGDGGSIDDILGAIPTGKPVRPGKEKKEVEAKVTLDYQQFAVDDSIVLDIVDIKKAVQLAKSIPSLNELSGFIGFEVSGDEVVTYSSNVTEYLKSRFTIRNSEMRMEEGTFFTLPIDTLVKAYNASIDVVTIFNNNGQYRLSVIGGSIPVENNASVTLDTYKKSLEVSGDSFSLSTNIYRDIVNSLTGLASSAVSLQQKKITVSNGNAIANFLRCLAKKTVDTDLDLGLRIVDIGIIGRLLDNSLTTINVYKKESRITYVIGNSVYSCVETASYLNDRLSSTMDSVLESGIRVQLDTEELRKISTLITTLNNVDEVFTMKDINGVLNIQSKMGGEENNFRLQTTNLTNRIFSEGVRLNAKMFDYAISSYADDSVIVYLSKEGIIFETSDKRVLVGAELF
ncbi:MAG: hypothetical protein ACRC0R_00145 [Cetobacterium sp.]